MVKCLVTGGSGFLGQHLVRQLIDSGSFDVTVLDLRPVTIDGAECIVGDLTKPEYVQAAVQGKQVVFHVATASLQGNNANKRDLMYQVNVVGTRNVIAACKLHGVKQLIYTSSASVVFEGKHLCGVDESQPYAARPMDYYTETKIQGEKEVLEADCPSLSTVALRPSGIFGEGDPLMVPTLVAKAKEGKSKFLIGTGTNQMDFTYVANVAQAHLDAWRALEGGARSGGAYFITNGEPRLFWGFTGDLLEGLGYPRASIKLPWLLVYLIALFIETAIAPVMAAFGKELQTDFTTFRVTVASCERRFDMSKARKELGFEPKVSLDEAMKRTVEHFQFLAKPTGDEKTD